MTETMLERMARAIDPVAWIDRPEDSVGLAHILTLRRLSLHNARAAVEAMREPTDAMYTAGHKHPRGQYQTRWHAMIDAILQEHPGTAHDDSQPAGDDQHHHGSVEQGG